MPGAPEQPVAAGFNTALADLSTKLLCEYVVMCLECSELSPLLYVLDCKRSGSFFSSLLAELARAALPTINDVMTSAVARSATRFVLVGDERSPADVIALLRFFTKIIKQSSLRYSLKYLALLGLSAARIFSDASYVYQVEQFLLLVLAEAMRAGKGVDQTVSFCLRGVIARPNSESEREARSMLEIYGIKDVSKVSVADYEGEVSSVLENPEFVTNIQLFEPSLVRDDGKIDEITGSQFRLMQIQLEKTVSFLSIQNLIKLQATKNMHHKIYKGLFMPGGAFFRASLRVLMQGEPSSVRLAYSPSLAGLLTYKHCKVRTKELSRPFVKVRPACYWKKLEFSKAAVPDERLRFFLQLKGFKMFNAVMIKGNILVPTICVLNSAKERIEFYVSPNNQLTDKHLEICTFEIKTYSKLKRKIELSAIESFLDHRFMHSKRVVRIVLKSREETLLDFGKPEAATEFAEAVHACLPFLRNNFSARREFKNFNFKRQWEEGEISTFHYLQLVNFFASRSPLDFS